MRRRRAFRIPMWVVLVFVTAAACTDSESALTDAAPLLENGQSATAAPVATAAQVSATAAPVVWQGWPDIAAEAAAAGVYFHDAGPLEPRLDTGLVMLPDNRIVVWGGDMEGPNFGRPDLGWIQYTDGAIFDPRTQQWTPVTPTELMPKADPGVVPVLVGDEVFFFRGRDAAAWNWQRNEWRDIGDPPADVFAAVSVGETVFALGPDASYDPVDNTWITRPGLAELRNGKRELVPGGSAVFVVSAQLGAGVQVDSLALNGNGSNGDDGSKNEWVSWPTSGQTNWFGATWHDGQLVIAGTDGSAKALDADRSEWTSLPNLPLSMWKGDPSLYSSGGFLIAEGGGVWAILNGDSWKPVRRPAAFGRIVAGQSELWSYGLVRGEPALWSFDPSVGLSSTSVPLGEFDLDATDAVVRVRRDEVGAPFSRGALVAEMVMPNRSPCSIEVAGPASENPFAQDPVAEEPISEEADEVAIESVSGSVATITCDEPINTAATAGRVLAGGSNGASVEQLIDALASLGETFDRSHVDVLPIHSDGIELRMGAVIEQRSSQDLGANEGQGWQIGNVNILNELAESDDRTVVPGLSFDCLPAASPAATPTFVDTLGVFTAAGGMASDSRCSDFAMILYLTHDLDIVAIDVWPG